MDSLLKDAVEAVLPGLEKAFPLVPRGTLHSRVEGVAVYELTDYIRGPSYVRSLFIADIRRFLICCNHVLPGGYRECFANRSNGACPINVKFPEERHYWATRPETRRVLVPGGYVARIARDEWSTVLLTPRGWQALEAGEISSVEEKSIELLCKEVHRAVQKLSPVESIVEVLPQKGA
jgi:hypothetical protein